MLDFTQKLVTLWVGLAQRYELCFVLDVIFKIRLWGLDQIASPRNLIKSEAKPRTGSKCEDLKSGPVRIGGLFIRINHYLKWGELILIQSLIPSKDWINFDPVLGQDQYTSSGIQYYHVSKIKQYGWLIYSWIINEFEIFISTPTGDDWSSPRTGWSFDQVLGLDEVLIKS
jgi:hypothetical protein